MHAQREQRLFRAGMLFAFGSAIHIFDHLRRGEQSVTESLNRLGTTGVVVQVAVVTLILTRHRLAPIVAAAAGITLAIGFTAVHWLPHWSSLSDSFVDHRVSWFSYAASLLEIAGAVAIAITGFAVFWKAAPEHPVGTGSEAGLP